MKAVFYLLLLILFSTGVYSQETVQDSIRNDSIMASYEMQEIVISNVKSTLTPEQYQKFMILRRRVLKVYPFAKAAAERLTILNANMAKLKTTKEKNKYSKIVEKYLENEFEGQLKKLSRKDGQVLVKLIYRQTGHTTFDLIKEYKSGWKAFWSTRVAKLFDIDIKKKYDPAAVPEDYYIEGFLIKAFEAKQLQKQDPAFTIDYDEITDAWREKNKAIRENQKTDKDE